MILRAIYGFATGIGVKCARGFRDNWRGVCVADAVLCCIIQYRRIGGYGVERVHTIASGIWDI